MKFWRPPYPSGKEEDVLKLILEITELVCDCVEEMKNGVVAFVAQDYKAAEMRYNNCAKKEDDADRVRRKLERALYASGFLSFSREDKYQLAERIDDVADQAEKACGFLSLKKIKVDKELGDLLIGLAEKTLHTVLVLKRAIKSFDETVEKTFQEVDLVEEEREKVRRISHKIAEKLFNDKLNPIDVQLLWELTYRITKVADMAEEASDRVGAFAVKSGE